MPKAKENDVLGAPLAPAPSDLEEMMSLEQPVENFEPFDKTIDEKFSAEWSSAEASQAGKNTTMHVGAPKRTLYDFNGNSRQVPHTDVPMLVDASIDPQRRLYIRCPKCVNLPNHGIHTTTSPNACPGMPRRKWMPCPICASYGRDHKVFEDTSIVDYVPLQHDTDDEDFVAPPEPSSIEREQRLEAKLQRHMVTFHNTEADMMYGLRKIPTTNGFVVEKH